ncbi:MAG TPA: hypothetical protein VGV92_09710 [Gammaproteobacteria bacterium]|nr:hypothetical protein [Gammaproteobacteria bacterium]
MEEEKGAFIPFRMDYSTKEKKPGELTNEQQADRILENVRKLKDQGYEKVGITYSANRQQADKIRGAYEQGKWKVGIKGSNQAEVMAIVEKKLSETRNSDLRSVFQVLPLTTMDKKQKGNLDPKCFEEDKKFIDSFIENKNSVVLGWQNQDSNDQKTDSKFAVGGGRTKETTSATMSEDQSKAIQGYLSDLRKTHPAPVASVSPAVAAQPVETKKPSLVRLGESDDKVHAAKKEFERASKGGDVDSQIDSLKKYMSAVNDDMTLLRELGQSTEKQKDIKAGLNEQHRELVQQKMLSQRSSAPSTAPTTPKSDTRGGRSRSDGASPAIPTLPPASKWGEIKKNALDKEVDQKPASPTSQPASPTTNSQGKLRPPLPPKPKTPSPTGTPRMGGGSG